MLFYTATFGLRPASSTDVASPRGLVQSRVLASPDGAVRIPLNVAPPIVDGPHALPQHIAFACTDVVALASAVGGEPEGWLLSDDRWRSVGDERRYIRAVRRSSVGAVLVAVRGDEIIGRLSVARDLQTSCAHVAGLGLMVAREHRRRGVGRALMDAAERWARSVGVTKLELHVFPHNEPAIKLYEEFGFEHEGLRRGHFRRGGQLVDAVLMAYRVD